LDPVFLGKNYTPLADGRGFVVVTRLGFFTPLSGGRLLRVWTPEEFMAKWPDVKISSQKNRELRWANPSPKSAADLCDGFEFSVRFTTQDGREYVCGHAGQIIQVVR
jgi:hypothetical protein